MNATRLCKNLTIAQYSATKRLCNLDTKMWETMKILKLLSRKLDSCGDKSANKKMNLVFFHDALEHATRITEF